MKILTRLDLAQPDYKWFDLSMPWPGHEPPFFLDSFLTLIGLRSGSRIGQSDKHSVRHLTFVCCPLFLFPPPSSPPFLLFTLPLHRLSLLPISLSFLSPSSLYFSPLCPSLHLSSSFLSPSFHMIFFLILFISAKFSFLIFCISTSFLLFHLKYGACFSSVNFNDIK